jgi:hypothetical protein
MVVDMAVTGVTVKLADLVVVAELLALCIAISKGL